MMYMFGTHAVSQATPAILLTIVCTALESVINKMTKVIAPRRFLTLSLSDLSRKVGSSSLRDLQEESFLQHHIAFETEIYRREPERRSGSLSDLLMPALSELEKWSKMSREGRIRRATTELSFPYQIDFVTEAGFPEYLVVVEKEVGGVRAADWPPVIQACDFRVLS
jgi:hypothetical protein